MSVMPQTFKRIFVEELLTTPLSQTLKTSRRITIERAMPHLFIKGSPAGSLILTLKKDGSAIAFKTQPIADLVAKAGKTKLHYHGYISFIWPTPTNLAIGDYTVELSSHGYTFSEDAFIGWVKAASDESHTSAEKHPLDVRITELRRR